jgi:hypothetical protein
VIAVEIKKNPMKINAIDAKAMFVIISCDCAYNVIIHTPKSTPAVKETIPGIPRNGSGLSSTTSLIIDITSPSPCVTAFSFEVLTPTLFEYLQEIGTSQTLKPFLLMACKSSILALMPFAEITPKRSMACLL